MTVLAVTSLAGSPGVSTAALALGVHWRRPVVVVEADTNAVTSVMTGFFRSNLVPELGGLDKVQAAYGRGVLTAEDLLDPQRYLAIAVHTLPDIPSMPIPGLPNGHEMWVVPGFFHLGIVGGVTGLWSRLPELLRSLSRAGFDVILDLGRLGRDDARLPLLDTADTVLIAATATMVGLNRIYRRLELSDLAQRVDTQGRNGKYWLLLNEPAAENVPATEFSSKVLRVAGTLPFDPAGAATFSLGREDPKPTRNRYRTGIVHTVVNMSAINDRNDLDRTAS